MIIDYTSSIVILATSVSSYLLGISLQGEDIFNLIIGPSGVLVLLIIAVRYFVKRDAEQRKELKKSYDKYNEYLQQELKDLKGKQKD
jgi:hypothetical protein